MTLRNKLQWYFDRNSNSSIQENAFERVVCEMAAILSWPQWVNAHCCTTSHASHRNLITVPELLGFCYSSVAWWPHGNTTGNWPREEFYMTQSIWKGGQSTVYICGFGDGDGDGTTCYCEVETVWRFHDDVIKWKYFPHYWSFVWGIHRWPVNSPHKGQWRRALMFSLIYAQINGWVNNHEAGDLRCRRAHYDVNVIFIITK